MSDPYRLGRDVHATIRLNLQHYIWKEAMGYLLHPSIKVTDSPDLAIADVGTGSGIWLHDLSRQYPQAQFHGFDISGDQYPAPGFLPSNISLRILDILKDIPAEYVEKYDVVHARLLVQVVNQAGGDPRPVIKNLMRLVKPGGYIQWEEPNDDAGSRKLLKADPSNSTEATERFLGKLHARMQARDPWSASLAKTLEEQGLANVQAQEFPSDQYVQILDQNNYHGLYSELLGRLPPGPKEEMTELHGAAIAEGKKGVSSQVRRFTFVGQKQ